MNYRELLERARSQLPSDVREHKRFEVPPPRSFIIGMRTILANFKEICDALNREPRHVLKFFSGEMATATTMQRNRAIFQGKFRYDTLRGSSKDTSKNLLSVPYALVQTQKSLKIDVSCFWSAKPVEQDRPYQCCRVLNLGSLHQAAEMRRILASRSL